jgi:hypothetical protein
MKVRVVITSDSDESEASIDLKCFYKAFVHLISP